MNFNKAKLLSLESIEGAQKEHTSVEAPVSYLASMIKRQQHFAIRLLRSGLF